MVVQDYAVYSSNDAAATAYINLIHGRSRYKDAWSALTDDNASIDDFATAIKKGGYATAPDYASKLEDNFKSVKNDYKKMITSEINHNDKKIGENSEYMKSAAATQEGIVNAIKENAELSV